MLQLINFIKSNSDWEQKLQEKPYCLTIKRKDNFIIFNYNQIESDFGYKLVRESRGIIIDENELKVVCYPFNKFFNHTETYADKIDWNTAKVQEKLDGSIIKLWHYNNRWYVSTNGTIDAREANLSTDINEKYKTFYDLFMQAVDNAKLNFDTLNKNYTYMFELISPFNKIVVPYTETKIVHIGTSDNQTLKEININIGVEKPKEYSFKSIEECIKVASELPFNKEGYVVVDGNWNRIKIKSPAYVAVHHLKNNGIVTKSRVLELIMKNEHEEFLNYYPEFKEVFNEINIKLNNFIFNMDQCIETANKNVKLDNRKSFAEFAKTTKCPPLMFNWLDKKINNTKEWLNTQRIEKILKWIGV